MITGYNLMIFRVLIRAVLTFYLRDVGRSGYHGCDRRNGRLALFRHFSSSIQVAVEYFGNICSIGRRQKADQQRDTGQQHGGLVVE